MFGRWLSPSASRSRQRPSRRRSLCASTPPPTPRPLLMDADVRALERALTNVVANAIKFSPAGGEVDLTAKREGEAVEIVVVDRGIGIDDKDQPRLFERFFRASSGYDQVISGSGLGLAIVKEIVEGHGGEVSLQSSLGEGTTVTLRLPAMAPDEADPVATAVA